MLKPQEIKTKGKTAFPEREYVGHLWRKPTESTTAFQFRWYSHKEDDDTILIIYMN